MSQFYEVEKNTFGVFSLGYSKKKVIEALFFKKWIFGSDLTSGKSGEKLSYGKIAQNAPILLEFGSSK